jgi:LruC domain-containing protein
MKKYFSFALLLLLVGTMSMISSCNRDNDTPQRTKASFVTMEVADNFNWNLTKKVKVSISGLDDQVIDITDQYDENSFHKAYSVNSFYETEITIPSHLDTISINKQSVAVQDHIVFGTSKTTKDISDPLAFGEEETFRNKKVQYIDATYLSGNTFITIFQDDKNGAKGSAVIGTYEEDEISFGDISRFNNGYTRDMSVVKLGADKVLVAYYDKDDSYNGNAVIGTINGTSINWSNEFTFDNGKVDELDACAINSNKVVITYQDRKNHDAGTAIVATIFEDQISFGSKTVFNEDKSDHLKCTALGNNNFVVTFQDEEHNDGGAIYSGQVNGNNIVWSDKFTYSANKTDDPAIEQMGQDSFVIAFHDEAQRDNGTAFYGTVNNNTISMGTPSVFNVKKTDYISIAKKNDTEFYIAYTDHNNSRKGTVIMGTVSGNNLNWSEETVFNAKTKYSSIMVDSNDDIIISFQDDHDGDKGKAIKTYTVQDSDGDDIDDHEDDFPEDEDQAFAGRYPAEGFGTLGFEDLWPDKGDYDFNDLVIDYRFEGNNNSSNNVNEVIATFVIKATGAGYENGFGFNLPESVVPKSAINVTGYQAPIDGVVDIDANGCEKNQSAITIIPFSKVPYLGNTQEGGMISAYDTIRLTVEVNGNYSFADFHFEAFNPFLIVDQTRGREVHLPSPNYPPTDLVDGAYFGTFDDDSDVNTSKYYKTANNLPWVINIPVSFRYPYEKIDITQGYHHLVDWVESNGELYDDWYLDLEGYRDNSKLYPPFGE